MTGRRRAGDGTGGTSLGIGMLAVAALLVTLVGCSSALPLDEYVTVMESTTDAYVTESQGLSFDYQSAVEDGVRDLVAAGVEDPEAEAVVLVRSETVRYLALLTDAMDRYRAGIDEPEPPGPVVEEHAAYVAAVTFVVDSLPESRAAVESAESLEDVQRALTASGFADGQIRWTATCANLEQAVRNEGRGMDLQCVADVAP